MNTETTKCECGHFWFTEHGEDAQGCRMWCPCTKFPLDGTGVVL